MARKSSVPDWVYYLAAVLCSLATIPMYRYMLVHAGEDRHVDSHRSAEYQTVIQSRVDPVSSSTVLVSLAADELCEAGYLVIKSGNAYRQGMGAYGQPARCVPGYTFAHVVRPGDSCMSSGAWLQVSSGHGFLTDMRCVQGARIQPR